MMPRREAVKAILAGLALPFLPDSARGAQNPCEGSLFSDLERKLDARVGVAALDVSTGRRLAYRADERFPMCSTFKWLLAAQVLSRVDAGHEQLSRVVQYAEADLLAYAPVARARYGEGGLKVSELLAAAIEYSDNTAANLLLGSIGGPAALTAYLRHLGDPVTRLDRIEPSLNSAQTGDVRDTTTPRAMVDDMRALLVGHRIAKNSQELLLGWLIANTTGDERLRAGVPKEWRIGDKTGTGANGATNDVAIMWPSPKRPVLVAAYITETAATPHDLNEALAGVGRAVAMWVAEE